MTNPTDYEYKTVVIAKYTPEELAECIDGLSFTKIIGQLLNIHSSYKQHINIILKYRNNFVEILGDRLETEEEKFLRLTKI